MNSGTLGDAGSTSEMQVEFKGMFQRGPAVDLFAKKIVQAYNLYGQNFTQQVLPSYMYGFYGADAKKVSQATSIDMDDRIQTGDRTEGVAAYTDDIVETWREQRDLQPDQGGTGSGSAYAKNAQTGGTFGETAILTKDAEALADDVIEVPK